MIHEVYEEGAAARDGRLWAGDQILEVCVCVRATEAVVRLYLYVMSFIARSKMEMCVFWFEGLDSTIGPEDQRENCLTFLPSLCAKPKQYCHLLDLKSNTNMYT